MNGSNGTFSTLSTFFGQLIYKSLSSIIQFEEAKHFVMWLLAENAMGGDKWRGSLH